VRDARSVSGETDETDETDEIPPREEIRATDRTTDGDRRAERRGRASREASRTRTAAGRRVGNETSPVRYVLDDVSDDVSDETDDAREFYPLIFLPSARARDRRVVDGRRKATKPTTTRVRWSTVRGARTTAARLLDDSVGCVPHESTIRDR
jgi:hypothetical protein